MQVTQKYYNENEYVDQSYSSNSPLCEYFIVNFMCLDYSVVTRELAATIKSIAATPKKAKERFVV